jgi:hypothetical protein
MADITDFDIGQGETFKILTHIFTEVSSSIPLNITDYDFVGHVRENYTTTELAAQFNIQKIEPHSSGSLFILLTPEQTTQLSQRMYVYDILMINNDADLSGGPTVRRLLEGSFTIRPAVTYL